MIEDLIKKYEDILEINKDYMNNAVTNAFKEIITDLKNCENKLKTTKLLLVEDGFIDIYNEEEKLNELGYEVLIYRKGANKPEVV